MKSYDLLPLAQLNCGLARVLYCNLVARYDECLETVKKNMELARKSGVHAMDFMILGNGTISALGEGDEAEAERLLKEMKAPMGGVRPWDLSFYYFLAGWLAFLQGRLNEAGRHVDSALSMVERIGDIFGVGLSYLLKARILHASGDDEKAIACIGRTRRIGRRRKSSMFEFMCLLALAEFSLERDREASMNFLRGAMAVGRKEGFVNTWILWRRRTMSTLCAAALEEGIEVDYVRHLIQRRALAPESSALHIENWPWKLKVYTLGHFELWRDGNPVRFTGKAQKKPLDLLKALIAQGGVDVYEHRLADMLWSDSEGDAAYRALLTTLQRLRKLLGSAEAVRVHEGRLSLDPHICWVDTWAFERLYSQANGAWSRREAGARRLLEHLVSLYRGPFLGQESDEHQTVALRESLRSKFLHALSMLCRSHEKAGEWDKAAQCYRRGLEIDDLAEEFYRGLMVCYQKLGNTTRALDTYRRCRTVLASGLGIEPSAETEAIYTSIKNSRSTSPLR